MRNHRDIGWLLAAIVGFSICVVDPIEAPVLGRDAHAVVGRPLTPVSYAGVARRTTRRAVRRTAYTTAATTTVVAAPVTALPADCTQTASGEGTVQYTCGATQYEPYYDGPNVVYEQVE